MAFGLRLASVLGRSVDSMDLNGLIEDELLSNILYPATEEIATMRTSLNILRTAADFTPMGTEYSKRPARITGEMYREMMEQSSTEIRSGSNLLRDPKIWHFIHRLHNFIRAAKQSGNPMEPFTVENLIKIHDFDGADEEGIKELIHELTSSGVLKSVGTPFLVDPQERNPEPYLPSQDTIMDPIYYPLAAKTPHEVKKDAELAELRLKVKRLTELVEANIIPQSIYAQRLYKLLGLDDIVDAYIDGKEDLAKTQQSVDVILKEWT